MNSRARRFIHAQPERCLDIFRLSTRSCDCSAKKQPPMSVALAVSGSPFLFRINYRRRSVFTACAMKFKSCWKQKKTQASEWLNEIRIPMRHVSLFIARSGEWMRPSVANSCFLYRLMPRSRFRFQLSRTSFHSTILNATTTTIRWSDLRNYTHDSIWPFKKEEIKSLRLETWKVFFFREP